MYYDFYFVLRFYIIKLLIYTKIKLNICVLVTVIVCLRKNSFLKNVEIQHIKNV